MACAIIGVPRKNSTYTLSTSFTAQSTARFTGLSLSVTGMVCTSPTANPMRHPTMVPTMAMRRLATAPSSMDTPYS